MNSTVSQICHGYPSTVMTHTRRNKNTSVARKQMPVTVMTLETTATEHGTSQIREAGNYGHNSLEAP